MAVGVVRLYCAYIVVVLDCFCTHTTGDKRLRLQQSSSNMLITDSCTHERRPNRTNEKQLASHCVMCSRRCLTHILLYSTRCT